MAQTSNINNLYREYGITAATPGVAGEYVKVGDLREIEVEIDLTTLSSSATILDYNVFVPKMRIQEVQVITKTAAASSGGGTLNVGLIRRDDGTTAIDTDGLVEALAVTAMDAAGETTVLRAPVSGTSVGDLIGTTPAYAGYICANYGTAVFQSGVVKVKIFYYAV